MPDAEPREESPEKLEPETQQDPTKDADGQDNPPEATNPEPEPEMPMLKGPDIPWHVMEIIGGMPKGVKPLGFMQAQVNTIMVTDDGFYGHYDGTVQKLPVTLIDNS